jgi:hypothetical protein
MRMTRFPLPGARARSRLACCLLFAVAVLNPGWRIQLAAADTAAAPIVIDQVGCPGCIHDDDQTLRLVGGGSLHYAWVFTVMVAALYLPSAVPPDHALDDVGKRLEFHYRHAIHAADFVTATARTIRVNSGPDAIARIRPKIDQLDRLYVDIHPGQTYALDYAPGRGTRLLLDGRVLGTMPGRDFAAALFAIWLGPQPLDGHLYRALTTPTPGLAAAP